MLGELVKAAADHDLEKQLLPIWLVHYAIKTLQGGKPMSAVNRGRRALHQK